MDKDRIEGSAKQAKGAIKDAAGKVMGAGNARAKPARAKPQADIAALERELSESLNTQVSVLHGRGGKGRLVIHYSDLDSLEGVLERLRTRAE